MGKEDKKAIEMKNTNNQLSMKIELQMHIIETVSFFFNNLVDTNSISW